MLKFSPLFCWFWDHALQLTSVASPARCVRNCQRLMDCIQTCSLRLQTRNICNWRWGRRSWNRANGHWHWQRLMVWRSWDHGDTFSGLAGKTVHFLMLEWLDELLHQAKRHGQVPWAHVVLEYLSISASTDIQSLPHWVNINWGCVAYQKCSFMTTC